MSEDTEDKKDTISVKPCTACGTYHPVDRSMHYQLIQCTCGLDMIIETDFGSLVAYQFRPEDPEELKAYTAMAKEATKKLNDKWESAPKVKTKVVYFAGIPIEVEDKEEEE